jgi:ligand-binding SRPBCC domain-containing protein
MPTIQLEIIIHAPQQVVFDLARSIDLHQVSTAHTGEKAIAGRTSGLIELGETVTWQAKHLGITQQLTSKITAMQPYTYFVDEMVSGAFKSIRHEHHFIVIDNFCTRMEDVFNYRSPFGIIGKMADVLFLQNYMRQLLLTRNQVIKKYAEDKMQANNC